MMNSPTLLLIASVFAAAAIAPAARAAPSGSLAATGSGISGFVSNDVLSMLGSGRLPLYDTIYDGLALKNVNTRAALTWWTAASNKVTETGLGTVTLPVGDGGAAFPAARFTGLFTLDAPQQVTFDLSADDEAYLYIDGTLVSGRAGIASAAEAPASAAMLGAGTHHLDLFYTDRQQTSAALNFSVVSSNAPLTPVPEPASLALFATGLLGLAFTLRRKKTT